MRFYALVLALASGAVAAPSASMSHLVSRQTVEASLVPITDQLLFKTDLPWFTARRNRRDPPTLDWTSDGCTSSIDNPFGFPFVQGCNRHDFGYQNYRIQNRFTQDAKDRMDLLFRDEYVLS